MYEVIREYTDTAGVHHLVVSVGEKTGDVVEYVSLKTCPFCGRHFTDSMLCECGQNNANMRRYHNKIE